MTNITPRIRVPAMPTVDPKIAKQLADNAKLIEGLQKQIEVLQHTIDTEVAAHITTRTLAGQQIGAQLIQLADCKCPGVKPENTIPVFTWLPTESKK